MHQKRQQITTLLLDRFLHTRHKCIIIHMLAKQNTKILTCCTQYSRIYRKQLYRTLSILYSTYKDTIFLKTYSKLQILNTKQLCFTDSLYICGKSGVKQPL